jgi:hypothetical protein
VSATISSPAGRWLPVLLSGRAHQVIGQPDRPYLLRWFLIPPNRTCNIYLHRFLGSDDPTPHDHPWNFVSIVLSGSYIEELPDGRRHRRRAGHLGWRRAEHRHRVVLATDARGAERPCTTLVITGRHRRDWGFWCAPGRFVPWPHYGPGGCADRAVSSHSA